MSDPGSGGTTTAQPATATASASGPANLSPSSTHHVKQLLQQYAKNAPLSLTGPSAIIDTDQARFTNKYAKFKLNNDVSLSKVYPSSGDQEKSPGHNGLSLVSKAETGNFEPNGQMIEQINKQMMLQRAMRQYQEQLQLQAERERERSRERQLSGRSRQNSGQERGSSHLSGEQIRKLRENQKHQERLRAEEERRAREARLESINGKDHVTSRGKPAFKSPANIPIMSSSDSNWSELEETSLDGEHISCFNVGGEFRLCLPQILNSVLEKVSLQAINQACDELQIYCSTCSKDQLQVLKDAKILPMAAHQCGLITKSDAERLCSYLLDKNPPRASVFDPKSSPFSFKVQHDCFGRCEGLVLPEAYTSAGARCIECLQCEGLFSPQKFVCHAHDNVENRTCHWGFDSNNWRTYIKLSEDYAEEEVERHTKVMEDFKNRYNSLHSAKRRQDDDHYDRREMPSFSKRVKTEESSGGPLSSTPPDPITMAMYYSKLNAFRPWSPAKGGFPPPLGGYPLQPPFRGPLPEASLEVRRPEDINQSSLERFRRDREHDSSPQNSSKRKFSEKDEGHIPSLAEEISTVADALQGAPVHAKETVLKILERLTQRLDRAERDRDMAIGRYRELQARFEQLEEELSKKRGELRELLRQDSRAAVTSRRDPLPALSPLNGRYNNCSTSNTNGNGRAEDVPENLKKPTPLSVIITDGARAKVEDKVEERSNDKASVVGDKGQSKPEQLEIKTSEKKPEPIIVSPKNPSLKEDCEERPNFDGTPPSTAEPKLRKKESDNLQERMIKMEAELTALREELSSRSSKSSDPSNPPVDDVQTNSSVPNGKDDSTEEGETEENNSETNHSNDSKEEEKNK